MDYVTPADVVNSMIDASSKKLALSRRDLLVATWGAIFLFFALGFEHAVVNMFLIPTGMLLGAKVGMYDWWVWNQIPVTIGNLVGFLCTGLALYATYKPGAVSAAAQAVAAPAPVDTKVLAS